MAVKRKVAKKVAKEVARTREKVSQVINQARNSLKLLETLEKETLAKARTFVKIPIAADRAKLTNEKILSSLKKLGVAGNDDLISLRLRIEKLEAALSIRDEGEKNLGAIPPS